MDYGMDDLSTSRVLSPDVCLLLTVIANDELFRMKIDPISMEILATPWIRLLGVLMKPALDLDRHDDDE
eukprot:scaffold14482_cov157-Amphora_coffeaeformis.AAC.7